MAPREAMEPKEPIDITMVSELTKADLTDEMAFHIEMIEDNYLTADILGLSLADEKRTLFIPLSVAEESDVFKKWLQDPANKKYASDSKAAIASLAERGLIADGFEFDLLLASYIVNPSSTYTDVASIVTGIRSYGRPNR